MTDEVDANTATSEPIFVEHYDLDNNSLRKDAVDTRYNPDGSVFSKTQINWTYDGDNRLTEEQLIDISGGANAPGAYDDKFSYDQNGNRTKESIDSNNDGAVDDTIIYTYNYDDQLTDEKETVGTAGTTTVYEIVYTYGTDGNGNLTTSNRTVSGAQTSSYTYDLRNRMTGVTITPAAGSPTSTAYTYDTNGVRVSEATGSNVTYYLNDPNNPTGYTKAIQESTTAGASPTRSYVLGLKVEAQSDSANGTVYLLTDGHGSTRALLKPDATLLEQYNYDAFGDLLSSTGAQSNAAAAKTTWLFAGDGLYDPATGFTYHLARWSNGFWWTQSDSYGGSIQDPLSLHEYLVDDTNFVNGSDPSGHDFSLGDMLVTAGISATLLGTLSGGLAAASGRNVIYNSVVGIGGGLALASAFFDGQLPVVAEKAIVVTSMTVGLLGILDAIFQGRSYVENHLTTYESIAVETFSWASISEAWFPAKSYRSLDGKPDESAGKLIQDIIQAFGQTLAGGAAVLGDVAGLATGVIDRATAKSELTDAFKTIAGNLLSSGASLAVDTLLLGTSFGGDVPSDVKSDIFTRLKGSLFSEGLPTGISDISSELADLIVDKIAG